METTPIASTAVVMFHLSVSERVSSALELIFFLLVVGVGLGLVVKVAVLAMQSAAERRPPVARPPLPSERRTAEIPPIKSSAIRPGSQVARQQRVDDDGPQRPSA
jgi:hypothetical protein